jgi:hypothetical protein
LLNLLFFNRLYQINFMSSFYKKMKKNLFNRYIKQYQTKSKKSLEIRKEDGSCHKEIYAF